MLLDPRHPSFIIIGAQKAGTTTLFQQICSHPDVFPSKIKETHYFTSADFQTASAADYYKKYFSGAENFKCKGEATPAYLRNGSIVIPRVEALLDISRIKFIVVLRDPVDRAWSHYLHRKRSMNETLKFDQALELEPVRLASGEENAGYFSQGLYGRQLAPWIARVGLENLLVLRFEDLVSDPQDELARVFDYLGLDPLPGSSIDSVRKNQGGEPLFPSIMRYLKSPDAPGKKILKSLLAPQIRRELKTRLRQMNVKPFPEGEKPTMDQELKNRLWASYQSDLSLLESSTGFDSGVWADKYSSSAAGS